MIKKTGQESYIYFTKSIKNLILHTKQWPLSNCSQFYRRLLYEILIILVLYHGFNCVITHTDIGCSINKKTTDYSNKQNTIKNKLLHKKALYKKATSI